MSQLNQVKSSVLDHPFHQACGLTLEACENGEAHTRFPVNQFTGNPQGALHGGILYALMDVTSYLALASVLEEGRLAVSVDVNTSVLRAARQGQDVQIISRVDRLGRTLAAMRCEAWVDIEGQRKLIATGHVTKSVLEPRP